MTKLTKILLALSLISFAVSFTGILWGLFLPAGAIAFGLFMISHVLAKEAALFDEEQRLRHSLAEGAGPASGPAQKESGKLILSTAHSH
jgi:hypothetical protein